MYTECNFAIKKENFESFVRVLCMYLETVMLSEICMYLKTVMLSEIYQIHKFKYLIALLTGEA